MLEQNGIPTAAIVTEPFRSTAAAIARSRGLPGYRFLEMPHPIANLSEDALQRQADEIVPQVVDLLLRGQGR